MSEMALLRQSDSIQSDVRVMRTPVEVGGRANARSFDSRSLAGSVALRSGWQLWGEASDGRASRRMTGLREANSVASLMMTVNGLG